ncbi:DUF2155 domain-containing protein [Pseudopontixanthobacter vadosimaris]|uniref:DUF2155 domain-containing protein n=1 Tax=Pseudopontixanthobacter vadosimaris TaxID=2726450 RepID=UPI0014743ADC|nr:DUF2155 domain-containing protein [Pseudopontixanthobacter vadosimaris]
MPVPASLRALLLAFPLVALAACDRDPPAPEPVETEVPEELRQNTPPPAAVSDEAQIGTPMAERVATIGVLNKRNNISEELEMSPGDSRRIGDLIVRMQACERTPPWELPKETGAFVQVIVRDAGDEDNWRRIFSGWMFRNSPSLNVVEHPIYDVWVKDCAMSFPGEEAGSDDAEGDEADAEDAPATNPA